jgi:uncharacterized membrane protein
MTTSGGPQGCGRRLAWKAAGPLGATVQWDAEPTRHVPGELLAWKTPPDAAIRHTGIVRLELADGGIRADVTPSSNPVAGAGRHAVAGLLEPIPKQQLDGDLLRMKTLVGTGRPPTTPPGN